MSDTARDYQIPNSVTTEGLDELFADSVPGSFMANQVAEPGSEPVDSSAVELVSTEEAAKRLGISARAVIKRLKSGSLRGFRDNSKHRAEWRIYWSEPSSEPGGTDHSDGSFCGTEAKNGTFKGTEEQDRFGTDAPLYLVELNKQLLEQVQLLTYHKGYLESQLAEREKDIIERDAKLLMLTDSQHKLGWWAKFSSWFFKAQ